MILAFEIVLKKTEGGCLKGWSRFISPRDHCFVFEISAMISDGNKSKHYPEGLRKLLCLIAVFIVSAGIGALLYILIKDEVQLKEMLVRYFRWGYIDVAWNGFKEEWLKRMFTFTDIRKWDV